MKKILLLEDNIELCKLLKRMFTGFGVTEVSVFHSYSEVTSLAKEELVFDIAVLDVNLGLGEKTGIDAFDWLIENDFKGKVIFLTGHASSYGMLPKLTDRPNVFLLDKPSEIAKIRSYIMEQPAD